MVDAVGSMEQADELFECPYRHAEHSDGDDRINDPDRYLQRRGHLIAGLDKGNHPDTEISFSESEAEDEAF